MTLQKKNSRAITVEKIRYRYKVSTSKQVQDGQFILNVTVERQGEKGCVLQVLGLVTRDYWLDFSDLGESVDNKDYPIVTPKHVASLILLALGRGWQADTVGPAFNLNVSNEDLYK